MISLPRICSQALILAVLAVLVAPVTAQTACRQALALGLDVSSSVDRKEYDQQMKGLAEAFLNRDVQEILLASPGTPVAVAVFEWGGHNDQKLLMDWQLIKGPADIQRVVDLFLNKKVFVRTSLTAMGRAITYGANLLTQSPECWQLTLDISADGKNNEGYGPLLAKLHPVYGQATVNGLIIGSPEGSGQDRTHARVTEMVNYFKLQVIHGPGSFVQVARGYEDYGAAMTEKLLRELQIAVSRVGPIEFVPDG